MRSATRKSAAAGTSLVNMRVPRRQRVLIDRAAAIAGKSRTEFVIEAACRAAEDVVLDRRLFILEAGAYRRFLAILDAPAQANPGLKRLMARRAPWER